MAGLHFGEGRAALIEGSRGSYHGEGAISSRPVNNRAAQAIKRDASMPEFRRETLAGRRDTLVTQGALRRITCSG